MKAICWSRHSNNHISDLTWRPNNWQNNHCPTNLHFIQYGSRPDWCFSSQDRGCQRQWCSLHSVFTLSDHSQKGGFPGGRLYLVSVIRIALPWCRFHPNLPDLSHNTCASGWRFFVMKLKFWQWKKKVSYFSPALFPRGVLLTCYLTRHPCRITHTLTYIQREARRQSEIIYLEMESMLNRAQVRP